MAKLAQQPAMAQVEINKLEAAHRSIWVAGWRPAVGWACAAVFAYSYILRDIISWMVVVWAPDLPAPPELDIDTVSDVLKVLLGLGAMRTVEKLTGRAK